jgi:negative regulator of sigma E activity
MPSDLNEPTLEELSTYIDGELPAEAQARVAQHVAGCADCQTRLDGLRQTAHAVRALPMETPPRTFTIPAQARSPFRWAPVGWLGGAAAALLIVIVGVHQLHFSGPSATSSASTVSGGLAAAAPYKQVAPTAGTQALDSNAYAARAASGRTVIIDPRNSSRSLAVGTDATSYSTTGVISLQVTTTGLSANEASSVRLILARGTGQGGYSVQLLPPTNQATFPFNFDAAYSIPQMQLPAPVAGTYTLQVTINLSNGSALVAQLPLTITP